MGYDQHMTTVFRYAHKMEVAGRSSQNRPAGTVELKTYTITADNFYDALTMEEGLLESMVDSMREVYPEGVIKLQFDNAPGHTGHNNLARIEQYIVEKNLEIELVKQPANSPDLNMCDLAFFRSLDCRAEAIKRDLKNAQGIDKIFQSVQVAFEEYDGDTLASCYGHLYAVYNAILAHDGDNNFNNPHAKVRKRLRNGEYGLIKTVTLDANAIAQVRDAVNDFFVGEFDPV
jgi:hypothetical protein